MRLESESVIKMHNSVSEVYAARRNTLSENKIVRFESESESVEVDLETSGRGAHDRDVTVDSFIGSNRQSPAHEDDDAFVEVAEHQVCMYVCMYIYIYIYIYNYMCVYEHIYGMGQTVTCV